MNEIRNGMIICPEETIIVMNFAFDRFIDLNIFLIAGFWFEFKVGGMYWAPLVLFLDYRKPKKSWYIEANKVS